MRRARPDWRMPPTGWPSRHRCILRTPSRTGRFRRSAYGFRGARTLRASRSRAILAGFGFNGIGRLKPGVTIAQANADLARLLPVWMDSWSNGPNSSGRWYENWKIRPAIRPLKRQVVGNVDNVLWVVMGTI